MLVSGDVLMGVLMQHLAVPVPVGVDGAPEGVDLAACASQDGASVSLFAVNTNDRPIELGLDHGGGAALEPAGGETVCDTRDLRQPDVMNHWTAPDRVRTVGLPVSEARIRLPALSVAAVECRARG